MLVILFFIRHICTKIYQSIKVFNDTIKILSNIYYHSTNLLINESINIVATFDECLKYLELVPCIEVIRSKLLDYYKNISITYLF